MASLVGMELGAANVTATGTVHASGCRIKSMHWRDAGGLAGSIVLRDGGSGGTTKVTLNTDANSGEHVIDFGPDFISFETDVHATLTNVDSLTIFYS